MAIGERFDAIIGAACDIIARRGFHQASTRDIARAAGLSLAGLYHYVGGKPELLFLVLDRSLARLTADLDRALAEAPTPERKLFELVRTHLDFGLHHAAALKIINRDHEVLDEPQRSEIVARRQAYLARGVAVLRGLDTRGRSQDELLSATNLLLGMLNGIATRPFVRSAEDARALAPEVAALFLHGFLDRAGADGGTPAGHRAVGGEAPAASRGVVSAEVAAGSGAAMERAPADTHAMAGEGTPEPALRRSA